MSHPDLDGRPMTHEMAPEAALAVVLDILQHERPEVLTPVLGRWEGPRVSPDAVPPFPIWQSRSGLVVMVSPQTAADGTDWLHVSFSRRDRVPDYADMCEVRERFFRATDVVLHVWPPVAEFYNAHEFCLHLWTRLDGVRCIPDLRGMGLDGRRGV